MNKGRGKVEKKQDSQELAKRCWEYLQLFLQELHQVLDRRLVKTLLDLVLVILMHRNRNTGFLLSELGDCLMGCSQTLLSQNRGDCFACPFTWA
jgi:hypothetical protein